MRPLLEPQPQPSIDLGGKLCLSRVRVSPQEVQALKAFSPYAWHQRLCSAFGQGDRCYLSRLDTTGEGITLHILSTRAPQVQPWGHWDVTAIHPSYLRQPTYKFQLRAHVVRRSGKVTHPVTDQLELAEWLERQGSEAGFRVIPSTLQIVGSQRQNTFGFARKSPDYHTFADFSGLLEVFDFARFSQRLPHGFGRAKGFHFGLLLVIPYQTF